MAPFLILSLLPFLISPSLSSIPSCSSDQFSVLLRQTLMFHSVCLFSRVPLVRGSRALPSVLFYTVSISLYSYYILYYTLDVTLLFTLF